MRAVAAAPAPLRRAGLAAVLAGLLLLAAQGLLAACQGGRPAILPPFALVDQAGRAVRSEDLRGRVLVVSFIFTTCYETCPIVTAQLIRAQVAAREQGLADRVRFLSITVDPVTDTPEMLRHYAARTGADLATWTFLTGPPDAVTALVERLEVTVAPGKRQFAHDQAVLFVDGTGRIVARHRDLELSPEQALAAIRKALGTA